MSEKRHSFVHREQVVYQWTQNLRYGTRCSAIPLLVGREFQTSPVHLESPLTIPRPLVCTFDAAKLPFSSLKFPSVFAGRT
jgi:hypothetical protein